MDPAPATTSGSGGRLIYCSPDRTLVCTKDPETGREELRKLYDRGSLLDAEREVMISSWLRHLDIVECRAAEFDPVSKKPCLLMEMVLGRDLEALVSERGALPAPLVCRIGARIARTLDGMHAIRRTEAAKGLCHGDIKPANVIWDGERAVLLDLEHCLPVGEPTLGWPAGTEQFAAPEAARGGVATPALDVFALGRTMAWLLKGGDSRCRTHAQDPELLRLIGACCGGDPSGRPPAAEVARRLESIGERLQRLPAQRALENLHAGKLEEARECLADLDEAEQPALLRLADRLDRLAERIPDLLDPGESAPEDAEALGPALSRAVAVLRRFPAHEPTLRRRTAIRHAVGDLLSGSLAAIGGWIRESEFERAAARLSLLRSLVSATIALPGQFPIPFDGDPRMPSQLHRQPEQFLNELEAELRSRREEHESRVLEITSAETSLDLEGAEDAIERLAERIGGTHSAVIRERDRMHRLVFWLERIARGADAIERIRDQVACPTERLQELLSEARQRLGSRIQHEGERASMGLRSLQLALNNLAEEFPSLAGRLLPCSRELDQLLLAASEKAWDLLDRAQQKLAARPVPVRPLETALHGLDHLRLLEAVADCPRGTRGQWMDRVEGLRLEVDQARSTRDRLASGAESAMAKGHWTTALFEMERAVIGLETEEEGSDAERMLQDRLAEAKKTKQDLEAALHRNMELAARFAELLDAPDSDYAERRRVLEQRRDCLQFLIPRVPIERAELYARDLREIDTLIAIEHAAEAEAEFDRTDDAEERLRLARSTLQQLRSPVLGDVGAELPGRIARLQAHWRSLAAGAERAVERGRRALDEARRRRRIRRVAGIAALVLAALAGLGLRSLIGGPSGGGRGVESMLLVQRPAPEIARGEQDCRLELRSFAAAVRADLAPLASDIVAEIEHRGPGGLEWLPRLHETLERWGSRISGPGADLSQGELAACQRFASAAWRAGIVLAAARGMDSEAVDRMLDAADRERPLLARHGIELPADIRSQVRDLLR